MDCKREDFYKKCDLPKRFSDPGIIMLIQYLELS